MTDNKKDNYDIQIITKRFILKPLRVPDVGDHYVRWMKDEFAKKYISGAANSPGIEELKEYVKERCEKEDILFLGIFEKETGKHIGNIKYEPVNSSLGYAIMGILIGEPEWRGKGVGPEVLMSSSTWLKQNRKINQILLGVEKSNLPAIQSYKKVGFVEGVSEFIPNNSNSGMVMILNLY